METHSTMKTLIFVVIILFVSCNEYKPEKKRDHCDCWIIQDPVIAGGSYYMYANCNGNILYRQLSPYESQHYVASVIKCDDSLTLK